MEEVMHSNVEQFLLNYGMHYNTIDMHKHKLGFISQMQAGLSGQGSSLQMIPGYISLKDNLPEDKEVIVIDAGGTNLRVGTMRIKEGKPILANFKKYPMPGAKTEVTADEFFNLLADYLEPVVDKSDKIGFCFSYPVTILPSGDGEIVRLTKEIRIKGGIGCILGENLNKALLKRGKKAKRIVILNDTVATMLGGVAANQKSHENYIGYILGTGTNTSYMEACANIAKIPEITSMPGQMAINIESGNYDGFDQGIFDAELDNESKVPGQYKMEKMISGAYQGNGIFRTVRAAVHDGLFSDNMAKRFMEFNDFALSDISDFCADKNGDSKLSALAETSLDKDILYEIIDANYERSARIAATVFAALLEHSDSGKDPAKPVCITAEGTTFTKSVLFRPKLDAYMENYIQNTLGRHCDIITVEDSSLRGAGIAILMAD
jgi:hexokinase